MRLRHRSDLSVGLSILLHAALLLGFYALIGGGPHLNPYDAVDRFVAYFAFAGLAGNVLLAIIFAAYALLDHNRFQTVSHFLVAGGYTVMTGFLAAHLLLVV
jgi:hypothetical protein